ncbi:Thylakoid membrane phosphoprotein 14 kDa [Musa troglodytarum]|uniref:Thylakoid membrane phosphoprotein 14 kDa n=1 Tax=Musa troglodytarum TaxID=320322 RepID=A0A9E7G7I6_9LILI|nr:Thylakoid membrane phosphoprotein 14 kDa [Musa troglodytarum]
MATTSATCGLTSRALLDPKAASSQLRPHSVRLPTLPPPRQTASWSPRKTASHMSRSVIAMATGETPAEVSSELPEVVKTIKDAWDKLDDKYAVASLVLVGLVALWTTTGMISAIDRLPIVPGVLELVGIGYTAWFVYYNLVFEPDREALIEKIKGTYSDIIGSSS